MYRLSHIDSFWAICGQPSRKWISAFQAVTNTATIIPTTTPNPTHSHAEHPSTQKTDRPSLHHTPRPDMQFISWKTCRRAKPGRACYLVSLQQPLLSMLYLDSFHPPADMRVSSRGPLSNRPEALTPRIPSPEGKIRVTWPTRQAGSEMCIIF